jgi:hypothetical protein
MGPSRARGPGYRPEIVQRAKELRAVGEPPSVIVEKLREQYGKDAPPLSTVKRWIKSVRVDDSDEPRWDFLAATPQERRYVGEYVQYRHMYMRVHPMDAWPSAEVARWFVAFSEQGYDDADVAHRAACAHLMAYSDDDDRAMYLADMMARQADMARKETEGGR